MIREPEGECFISLRNFDWSESDAEGVSGGLVKKDNWPCVSVMSFTLGSGQPTTWASVLGMYFVLQCNKERFWVSHNTHTHMQLRIITVHHMIVTCSSLIFTFVSHELTSDFYYLKVYTHPSKHTRSSDNGEVKCYSIGEGFGYSNC